MSNFTKYLKENQFLSRLLQILTYLPVRMFLATYRVRIVDERKSPTIGSVFYSWHQHIIPIATFFVKNKKSIHCVVSPSRDGKFLGGVTKMLGLKVLYGSAHKGPVKLVRNALKILKNEKEIFLIGDGSRGPARKLQNGILYLAKKSELPVVFIDCKVSRYITLKKTWDQFMIPLPFSKIEVTIKECSFK